MSCPTELTLSMHADGELPRAQAAEVESHAATCARCRDRLAAFHLERRAIAAALALGEAPVEVPPFEAPASRGAFIATATGVVLLGALLAVVPSLLADAMPAPLAWLNPIDSGRLVELGVRLFVLVIQQGESMMTALAETVLVVLATGLVVWIALSVRPRSRGPLALALVCAVALIPPRADAFEVRYAEEGTIAVAEGETIDDTLIALGETVEVNGVVTGDLVAFGERVIVRGRVEGTVITAAEDLTLGGEIGGTVAAAAEALQVLAAQIEGNLFGAGSTVTLDANSRVAENVALAGERVKLAGPVGRDVIGVAEELEVDNTIGGGITVRAERVTLLGAARVGGDLTVRGVDAEDVSISPAAVIGGETKLEPAAQETHGNRYASLEFYGFQVLRFAAAFATGALVLVLVPMLRGVTVDSWRGALAASGVGLAVLVTAPAAAALVMFTIIGIPVALFGVALWLAAIYLAKILLAHAIGARLLASSRNPRHYLAALALGLLVVLVAVNVPLVGGVFNFLLTICGLGALALVVWRAARNRPSGTPAAT